MTPDTILILVVLTNLRLLGASRIGASVRTVAVRGTSRSSAISPKASPRPRRAWNTPSLTTSTSPSAIKNQRSPGSPWRITVVSAGTVISRSARVNDSVTPIDIGAKIGLARSS